MSDPRPRKLADCVSDLADSEIRRMFSLADQHDNDLVRLELGEPDFDTPTHIINAANEAAKQGTTHYTHNAGIPELRTAIADEMQSENGVDITPENQVLVTTGAIEAIYSALVVTTNPGEEVIVPTPTWPSYYTQAEVLGIDLVEIPLSNDNEFDLSPQRIEEAVSEQTSAILLNTPSNPTGRVYSPETVREIVNIAVEHDIYVIADEVYEHLTYGTEMQNTAAIADTDCVLSVHSCSKTYAMTGWRVGWLTGPPSVIGAATKLHQATITCAPSVSQYAALAAIEGPQEPIDTMAEAFQERRDYVVKRIADLPEISAPTPQGGFYAFPDVGAFSGSSFDVAKRLLDEYGVVTVPGTGFGEAGAGHLRLSFANSMDRLELAFDRIEAMVKDELDSSNLQ